MQNNKKTLQKYLLYKLSLVMTISTIVIVIFIGIFIKPMFIKQIQTQDQWVAYYISNSITEMLKRQSNILENIHEVISLFPNGISEMKTGEYLEHIVKGRTFLKSVLLVDENGKVAMTNTSNLSQMGLDVTRALWYTSKITEDDYIWSSIYLSSITSSTAINCSVKYDDYVYVAVVDIAFLHELIKGIETPKGTHVDLIDSKGKYIVGHTVAETLEQTYANHKPSYGTEDWSGNYQVSSSYGSFFGNYIKLSQPDWTIAVMTDAKIVSRSVWIILILASLTMIVLIIVLSITVSSSNKNWLLEFARIRKRMHHAVSENQETDNVYKESELKSDEKKYYKKIMAVLGLNITTSKYNEKSEQDSLVFQEFEELIQDFITLLDTAHIAEEEAREKSEEAEKANQAKNRFLSNMGQEIRNPMNGILGTVDLLLLDEANTEKLTQLNLLQQSAKVLQRTMDDVLAITELDSVEYTINKVSFSIGKLLQDEILRFEPLARKKGIQLTLKWDKNLPGFIIGDVIRIQQILSNLLDNALRFTDEGLIRIMAQLHHQEGEIVYVAFTVQDTGKGLIEDERNRLFEDFYQGKESSIVKRKGTGLGLSICKRLVITMNGDLSVESEYGKGSRFTFVLPLQIEERENVAD